MALAMPDKARVLYFIFIIMGWDFFSDGRTLKELDLKFLFLLNTSIVN